MEIVGKIISVLPLQSGVSKSSCNPWSIQSYVLETIEQYPRKVAFELFGEERIKNNPCKVDDVVTVSFDIESREFNGRWYTSIRAWKIQQGEHNNSVVTTDNQQTVVQSSIEIQSPVTSFDEENSDLPF